MNEKTPLEVASARLRILEQLLVQPTPEIIRQADALLSEVAVLMAGFAPSQSEKSGHMLNAIRNFQVLCERVGKLLEGARRVQWIRLRLITSLTETYNARAEKKFWYPPSGNLNLHM